MVEASFSDKELLDACLRGNKIAWDYLVRKFAGLIYRTIEQTLRASNYTNLTEELPDLVNSVFVALLENDCKKLRQYRGKNGCTLASWIRIVSVRHSIDYMRKFRESLPVEEATLVTDQSPEHLADAAERRDMLRRVISKLSPKEQLFVRFYYEEELSPEEVADAMNLLVGTVYSMKNQVREKLKKIVSEENYVKENT